jgi:hypothetical protein
MDYVEKSAEVNVMLKDKDEIAIIPPVSGGWTSPQIIITVTWTYIVARMWQG